MDKASTPLSTNDEFESPAVKAAVAEERRFGGMEAQLTNVQATLTTLVSKVGEQNGRVGKLEVKVDSFILETNAKAVVNKAYQEGHQRAWSSLDKLMIRGYSAITAGFALYFALQKAGLF